MKFLRRQIDKKQFLQVLMSKYYGSCVYACQVWLGSHTKKPDLRKLDSLHYKLLGIVEFDWKKRISRSALDTISKARPATWSKYSTASPTMKILRDKAPERLHQHLLETHFYEKRKPSNPRFYDGSRKRRGRQAFGNRLK